MDCPACGNPTVAFAVPAAYRDLAPDGAEAVAICQQCLAVIENDREAPPATDADFTRIIEGFPSGDTGAAMALAVGLLVDSLALNRDAVKVLFDAVSDAGEDPWLVLERLSVAGTVQPDANLGKLRHQLEQLWR